MHEVKQWRENVTDTQWRISPPPSWRFVQYIDIYFISYQAKYPGNENKWAVKKIGVGEREATSDRAGPPSDECVWE